MNPAYICEFCTAEYSERGDGMNTSHRLQKGSDSFGLPLTLCGACGNIISPSPVEESQERPADRKRYSDKIKVSR